jgi:hypothetical protein
MYSLPYDQYKVCLCPENREPTSFTVLNIQTLICSFPRYLLFDSQETNKGLKLDPPSFYKEDWLFSSITVNN